MGVTHGGKDGNIAKGTVQFLIGTLRLGQLHRRQFHPLLRSAHQNHQRHKRIGLHRVHFINSRLLRRFLRRLGILQLHRLHQQFAKVGRWRTRGSTGGRSAAESPFGGILRWGREQRPDARGNAPLVQRGPARRRASPRGIYQCFDGGVHCGPAGNGECRGIVQKALLVLLLVDGLESIFLNEVLVLDALFALSDYQGECLLG
mmetsp:Transcript_41795/g.75239  ORF Transcript_41795/g.75239 Transcript_41795/m.75239 type:complete len:203 (+) Transcript_41795:1470-2078(+)